MIVTRASNGVGLMGHTVLCSGIVSMMSIKGPAWFVIELPLYLVVAWLAGRMEVNRPPQAA